jgi:hypothetical protein
MDYRLKQRTNGLPNVHPFTSIFPYPEGRGKFEEYTMSVQMSQEYKLTGQKPAALPTVASKSAAAYPSATAICLTFSLRLLLLTFNFHLLTSRVAAIAAALPSAAAAETAVKPPASRHPLRLHVAGNVLFPPVSRRFPPAWPRKLQQREREIQPSHRSSANRRIEWHGLAL